MTSSTEIARARAADRAAGWMLSVGVVVAALDFAALGVGSAQGASTAEWLLRLAVWFGPAAFVFLTSDAPLRLLGRPPLSWLTAVYLWAFVTSPLAERTGFSVLVASSTLGVVALSTWVVVRSGFAGFLYAVGRGTAALVAASVVYALAGLDVEGDGGASYLLPRLDGLTNHPNTLGQVSGLTLLAALWLGRRHLSRTTMSLSLAIGATGLVLSQSRTALVALGLAVVVRLLTSAPTVVWVAGLGGWLVAVSAWAAGVLPDALAALSRSGSPDELVTLTGRTQLWALSVDAALTAPVTGLGFGTQAFVRFYEEGAMHWLAPDSHSTVLQLLLTVGAVGVALFLVSLASWIGTVRAAPDGWREGLVAFVVALGVGESMLGVAFPPAALYVLAGAFASVAATRAGAPFLLRSDDPVRPDRAGGAIPVRAGRPC